MNTWNELNLIHYTDRTITKLHNCLQDSIRLKPNGLWVSVEGEYDWKTFRRGTNSF
jgi:hypothetical protein